MRRNQHIKKGLDLNLPFIQSLPQLRPANNIFASTSTRLHVLAVPPNRAQQDQRKTQYFQVIS